MQHSEFPTPRILFIVWLILMGLTVATMIAGKVTATLPVGIIWMAILLLVAGLKSVLILRYYLDLKAATGGWSKLFIGLIFFILLAVFSLYAAGA